MKIAVTICATKSYTYAMTAQARRVQSNLIDIEPGHIILAGEAKELKKISDLYLQLIPEWKVHILDLPGLGEHKNYKQEAQLVIAQMRTAAFSKARSLKVDVCWSLDSDVLPPANALQSMLFGLNFDDGYYSISSCSYPSQGGGGFLGGRGTPYNHILPDFTEEEREIPEDLKKEIESIRNAIKDDPKNEENHKKHGQLQEKIRECPSKGNVFKVNGEFGWKPRGWLDNAYPAIGKGSILPSDWCGFGCTLMNKKALNHAHFDGYYGGGTEDLYIVWQRWHQMSLRINVITHCLCDHVIRNPGKPGKYVLCQTYHEPTGEGQGHIRVRHIPWYSMDPGEKFDPENDGKLISKKKEPVLT